MTHYVSKRPIGLSKTEVGGILAQAMTAVASWRSEAAQLRIPKAEQDLMAAVFEP
jgi:hypothetical protein